MKRLVFALVAALALLGVGQATAQAASPNNYVITVQYDASVPAAWPHNAANLWEHGTKITFVFGPCSGPMCIHMHNWTGTLCSIYAVGCAEYSDLRTAECEIWLNGTAVNLDRRVLEGIEVHETGHCLGLGHIYDDPNSVMQPSISAYHPVYKPDANDIKNVNVLWP